MTEEKKEPIHEQQPVTEDQQNQAIPISDTDNPDDLNSVSADKPEAKTAEQETGKSWFEKLFQSNPSKLKEQLDDLTAKNEELKDKYLRLFADFDNYKKRMAKERLELIESAGKNFFKLLLPVVDDFERALKAFENAENHIAQKEGVELVYQKLIKILESKGVKAMETNGKEFNADLHEAIAEVPAPSDELKGKIMDTVEKGYYLQDKILRHAKVVVGK
jgi:molecular chaperone GrpE